MISGMDTEALVNALVKDKVERKNKYVKAKTKLEWKQDAYKAINTKVYSLYNKVSNLRFTSAYSLKKTTVSNPNKVKVTASGTASNGTQTLKVSNLAKAGYLTGAKLKGATDSTTLGELGFKDSEGNEISGDATFTVTAAGKSTDITVNKDTKISEVVDKLKNAGVNASFDSTNNRFFVSAKETGKENDFSLTGTDKGLYALKALGLNAGGSTAELDAYKTVAGYALDADGNSIYKENEDGSYTLTGALDADKTKAGIEKLLADAEAAKGEIEAAKSEKSELQGQIDYTKRWNAVEEFKASDKGTDEDKARLLYLLQEYDENSKYQTVDGNGVVIPHDEGYHPGSMERDIKTLARRVGILGEDEDDSDALKNLKENVKGLGKVFEDFDGSQELKDIYVSVDSAKYLEDEAKVEEAGSKIKDLNAQIEAKNAMLSDKSYLYWKDQDIDAIMNKIDIAVNTLKDPAELEKYTSEGATKVNGEDSKIYLNDAEFTSSSNIYSINGLTIQATGVTGPDEEITISTDTDVQGIYDKVKDFLSEYNSVMKELASLYNADSAKGYEPLTDDEKKEMSDSEVEKWEEKVKGALLRKDTTIGSIMDTMSGAMMKSYTINGKSYSLSSFGITTQGILNASKNEAGLYHIAGDADDPVSAGRSDKLMTAIQNNPDDVMDFLKELTSGLYKNLDTKMKSTSMKSAYNIYNDKQITKDIASYTKLVKEWETKVSDLEDRYYKQFSRMEKQLAKMQSATSSLGFNNNN